MSGSVWPNPSSHPCERLHRSSRRDVFFSERLKTVEQFAQDLPQGIDRVATHWKPRASGRAVGGECREDDRTAWNDRLPKGPSVRLTILVGDEKVVDGAIVPQVVPARWTPGKEVGLHEADTRVSTDALSTRVERCASDVEHRHVREAPADKVVGQKRSAATDIDHRGCARYAERFDQLQRHSRNGLIPAHALDSALRVRGIPSSGLLVGRHRC